MEHHSEASEVTFHHAPAQGTKRIWKTFWLLLIITVIELALGLGMHLLGDALPSFVVLFLKGVIVILSLAKAFYIVGVFMHLGDEIRNMIMTIVVPLMLFVWFIGAFLWDGNSYRTMRNRYDRSLENKTMQPPTQAKDTSVLPLH
ncbi:MAG TPA: cytochrome C oxidase subunit IV family protein [Flavisolibacter sp.]|jgi:4-amino-4-deoxy-L-arabinose transferase-like glycosyltransferase